MLVYASSRKDGHVTIEHWAIRGIDHVSFRVDDLDVALNFYERLLGFGQIPRPNGLPGGRGAWLTAGSVELHLTEYPAGPDVGYPPRRASGAASHVALMVASLDDTESRLFAAGYPFVTGGPTIRQLFVQDPSGNAIEFVAPEG
jgi:catechol 2,3-dioxygenase-like lactoylglutathione lyase family enzyme